MLKIKIRINNNLLLVSNKLSREEKIDEKEIVLMSNTVIIGFAKIISSKSKKLKYEIPNCTSIADYISSGIDKHTFYRLLLKFVDVIYAVRSNQLNINNLCLDLNYIFYDNISGEIYFIYRPVINNREFVNINKFLYDFVLLAKPLYEDDFKKTFISFLNENVGFDVSNYLNFIQKIYPELIEQSGKLNINQNALQILDDCEDTVLLNNYAGVPKNEDDTVLLSEKEFIVSQQFKNYNDLDMTQPLCGCEDTIVLDNSCVMPIKAQLIVQRNGAHVDISSNKFCIGKDNNCCDLVLDNPNISRNHITITFNGSDYFVTDNNSTNGTKLNGVILQAGVATKLENYDRLLLANEIIDFQIMEENN